MSMGIAIIVCVKISVVGEIIPAKIKEKTIKYFRLWRKVDAETIPKQDKKKKIRGNSKTMPNGNKNIIRKDKYAPNENNGANCGVEKLKKKVIAVGSTRI